MMADAAGDEEGGNGMHSDFNEKEVEVSEILLSLEEIFAESQSISIKKQQESELKDRKLQPFMVEWGAKKTLVCNTRRNPPSTVSASSGLPAMMVTPIRQVKASQGTSPVNPLNPSPVPESNYKSSYPSPKKQKRDGLMQSVEELSERSKQSRKVTATCGHEAGEEKSNLGIKSNSDVRSGQPYQSTVVPSVPSQQPQPQTPSVFTNPMAMAMAMESSPRPLQYQSPNAAVLGQVGPPMLSSNAVLDGTNQVASPCQTLDYDHAHGGESRAGVVARAAEARRRRKMIIRQKLELKLKLNSKCGSGTRPLLKKS